MASEEGGFDADSMDEIGVAFDDVVTMSLHTIQAQRSEPHSHSDDELWYSYEQLCIAAKRLTIAVELLPADERPIGWSAFPYAR